MSILAALAASAALGIITGRLTARPEIRKLRTTITSLLGELATLDARLRVAQHVAGHDRLTGLPNRYSAAKLFTVRELLGHPTIVAVLDLDRFKHINDTYGHHVGDDLLRTIAERLTPAAQDRDGTAARLAGDEFLLILPADGGDPAQPVAEIMAILAQPTTLCTDDGDVTVHPQASAGIAVSDATHATFDTMLWHADIALYHAKQQRGTHRTYSPDMRMPRNAGRHGPRRRDQRPSDGNPKTSGGGATS